MCAYRVQLNMYSLMPAKKRSAHVLRFQWALKWAWWRDTTKNLSQSTRRWLHDDTIQLIRHQSPVIWIVKLLPIWSPAHTTLLWPRTVLCKFCRSHWADATPVLYGKGPKGKEAIRAVNILIQRVSSVHDTLMMLHRLFNVDAQKSKDISSGIARHSCLYSTVHAYAAVARI